MMIRGLLGLALLLIGTQGHSWDKFLPKHAKPPKVLLNTDSRELSSSLQKRARAGANARLGVANQMEEAAEEGIRFFEHDLRETEKLLKPVEKALEKESLTEAVKEANAATEATAKNATTAKKDTTKTAAASTTKKEAAPAAKKATTSAPMDKKKVSLSMETLEHLFDHMKANIGLYNKKEKEMKAKCQTRLENEEKKLKQLQEEAKRKDLSAFERQLNKNQTETTEKLVQYWKDVRVSEKSQYRTSLQMTHTLMDRIKVATSVYKDRMAGKKVDPKIINALKASLPPPRSLIEERHVQLKAFRKEMKNLMSMGVRAALRRRLLDDRMGLSLLQH